jgi:tRNA pseudouridine13 synthase
MLIKHVPEDFIVEEVPQGEPGKEWSDTGPYAVFKLTKIKLNTEHAVEIVSKRFHIPSSDIKYAGTKDKHAHTTQYISIPNRQGISGIHIDEDNLKLEHVGYNEEPLSLGTLKGNRFIITVRELDHKTIHMLKSSSFKDSKINHETKTAPIIPNYFDEQRFSSNNYSIGYSIMKKEYKKAVAYMCESSSIYADTVVVYLAAHPNDYVGALQRIPKRTLTLFIHAVQSFIFNEALSRILLEHAIKNDVKHYIIPYSEGTFVFYENHKDYEELTGSLEFNLELVGFNTTDMNHNIKYLMNEIGLTQRDFIIRALPDLSVEGTTRESFVQVENMEIELLEERAILEFELPKGSYATIVVKALFKE